jgi:hypothetical protein
MVMARFLTLAPAGGFFASNSIRDGNTGRCCSARGNDLVDARAYDDGWRAPIFIGHLAKAIGLPPENQRWPAAADFQLVAWDPKKLVLRENSLTDASVRTLRRESLGGRRSCSAALFAIVPLSPWAIRMAAGNRISPLR